MEVYVVTNTELGWDCVVGVFDVNTVSEEEILDRFPENPNGTYVINQYKVETNLDNW